MPASMRTSVIAVIIIGTALFAAAYTHSTSASVEPPLLLATSSLRLTIPAIHVDAPIELMGLTEKGAMEAPKGAQAVGWLASSARPGEPGSAVMDGHFGWKDGLPAVFDHLSDLKPGDSITVENADGTSTLFVVRELKTYGKNNDPSAVFASRDGKSHLNLITCEGSWDPVSKTYSRRLVVFADKAS